MAARDAGSPKTTWEISGQTYDLYCCLLSSAVHSGRSEKSLTPFPPCFMKGTVKDFDRLRRVLALMPPASDLFKASPNITFGNGDLMEEMNEFLKPHFQTVTSLDDGVALFEFILKKQCNRKFSVHYISYQNYLKKNSSLVMKPDHIFELRWDKNVELNDLERSYTGYHGSAIENFFSIMTNSLQNYSGTEHMTTGNAFGNGIYLCEDVRVARDFSKGGLIGWKNSKLGSHMSAVVQCKVAGLPEYAMGAKNDKNRYLIVKNSEDVKIQYLLLFSHFKNEKELESSRAASHRMIYFYIFLLIAIIIGNYWKDIKRELKKLT